MGTNNSNNPGGKRPQPPVPVAAMRRSASLSKTNTSGHVQSSQPTPLQQVKKPAPVAPTKGPQPAAPSSAGRWLTFFFDGTGNNRDADTHTGEHSNVARLFEAHSPHDPTQGLYRFYIPGIGTYFKDIKDDGGSIKGLAFGGQGDDRLTWAMTQFDRTIATGKDAIHVALFGFSRGAALARAFARRLAARCSQRNGQWYLTGSTRPIQLYFMGLFDTVASVGLPASVNNNSLGGLFSVRLALLSRSSGEASLWALAPGEKPGADPTPGMADGHSSWASDLRIPAMVKRCVHMVAAHEIRNSFPLDSVLNATSYPSNCEEIVFPGVHSDVGGGYRAEEGARGRLAGGQLSLIPLRRMYDKALQSGVPMMKDFKSSTLKADFALDPGSAYGYQKLEKRYATYLKAAGNGGVSLGTAILSHMKLYYRWRFHKIALNEKARKGGFKTADQIRLESSATKWSQEKLDLDGKKRFLYEELRNLRAQAAPYVDEWGYEHQRTPEQKRYHQQAIAKEDEYLKVVARFDTLPGDVDELTENMEIYDEQLLSDAKVIQTISNKGKRKLRPHYQAILDAYVAEFEKNSGLKDPEIIAFFDDYVHDSLAAFAQDATLPSDPRAIYIGGDEELKYAMNSSGSGTASWANNTG